MPQMCLSVFRVAMPLEMRAARPSRGLKGKIQDTGKSCYRLQVAFEKITDAERSPVWSKYPAHVETAG